MDPKLALLFVLFSIIIGLSHLDDDGLARMRRQLVNRRWREFVPLWRKS